MERLRIAIVGLVGLAAGAIAVAPAHATFPGKDGKIAFQSNRDGNFEIYSMNPNGTSQTRLTTNSASDTLPSWSPDGTKIAFTSARDGNLEIYTMNADGSGQTRITNNPAFDEFPGWSPDGTKIVFDSGRDDPSGEIYTMNANGTNVVRLTNDPGFDFAAVWSPDGTKIAWNASRGGAQLEIHTMNVNGTSQTNITNNAARDEYPDWSPDGGKIIFDTDRDGNFEVYEMSSAGSGQTRLTTLSGSNDVAPVFEPKHRVLQARDRFAWSGDTNGNYEIQPGNVTNNAASDQFPDWQPVVNTYARPQAASPLRVPLVPAHKECSTSAADHNSKHAGTLSSPSCVPPTPESGFLTLGSPDFNGAPAKGNGYVRLKVFCNGGGAAEAPPCLTTAGDQLDASIQVSQTDVRCQGATGSCPSGALADYAGNLRMVLTARVTDRNNGGFGAGTLADVAIGFNVPCATTVDGTVGSTCSVTTSIDAAVGGATAITEQKRAIWQHLGRASLYDGGADGVASTTADNTLFATDGLFFP